MTGSNGIRGLLLLGVALLGVQCARQTPPVHAPRVGWRVLHLTGHLQRGAAPSVQFVARLQPPATITAAVVDAALGALGTIEIVERRATFVAPTGQRTAFALTPARMQRVFGLPLWPEQVIALFGGKITPELATRTDITAWKTVSGVKIPQQIRYDDDGTMVQVSLSDIEVER